MIGMYAYMLLMRNINYRVNFVYPLLSFLANQEVEEEGKKKNKDAIDFTQLYYIIIIL